MSEISIDNLPNEILEKIYGFLSYKDLKRATLVSQRWNSVISSSKKFLNQTKATLKLYEYDNDMSWILIRNYRNVCINIFKGKREESVASRVSGHHSAIKKAVMEVESSLDESRDGSELMKLVNPPEENFLHLQNLLQMLKNLPYIQELEINHYPVKNFEESEYDVHAEPSVELPCLKKLNIKGFDPILRQLRCENLEHFVFTVVSSAFVPSNCNCIVGFLNTLENLKSLELFGKCIESQIELHPKFKLKLLRISENDEFSILGTEELRNYQCGPSYREHIRYPFKRAYNQDITFYKKLIGSAEIGAEVIFLATQIIVGFVHFILEQVAASRNIEKLTIRVYYNCKSVLDDREFHLFLDLGYFDESAGIKELICLGKNAKIQSILSKFPNVEKLTVNSLPFAPNNRDVIPLELKKLKHIIFKGQIASLSNSAHFPELESIVIGNFVPSHWKSNIAKFIQFGKNHIQLKRVTAFIKSNDTRCLSGLMTILVTVFRFAENFTIINNVSQESFRYKRPERPQPLQL